VEGFPFRSRLMLVDVCANATTAPDSIHKHEIRIDRINPLI
jgi:hypothetical protein